VNEPRGAGRALFAAVFLMVGGVLNIVWGIAAIGSSGFFMDNQHYMFGSLKSWGWITLILGILEILASLSLFGGGAFGVYFGILAGSLAAIAALLEIPAYPLWSIAIFALSIWIIWGLAQFAGADSVSAGPERPPGASAGPRPPA
jgi:hypothetical protein